MKSKRYHFSVQMPSSLRANKAKDEHMHAFVPDEGGEEIALARLKADDPLWCKNVVHSHGLVEWFEPISMCMTDGPAVSKAA